jgi:hypothetical protein
MKLAARIEDQSGDLGVGLLVDVGLEKHTVAFASEHGNT